MHNYPQALKQLIEALKTLPGIGSKSAERFAFHILEKPQAELQQLANILATCKEKIPTCDTCGSYFDGNECPFCNLSNRDPSLLCIVTHPKDVFAIEQTHVFKGLYHVIGGVLSPLEGKGPDHLKLPRLTHRLNTLGIKEVVIAIDSTVEGDATSLYLQQELAPFNLKLSRVAFGLPLGSSFEYVDQGTLASSIYGRKTMLPQ